MDEYTVNIDALIERKDTLSCIKELFRAVQKSGYITPKRYFESISDTDLHTLSALVEQMSSDEASDHEQFEAQEHIMLMTIGFLVGEGTEINEETVTVGSSLVVLMVTLESLARKNLVRVFRENWALSADPELIWVERI